MLAVLIFVLIIAYVAGVGFRKGFSGPQPKPSPEETKMASQKTKDAGRKLLFAILALLALIIVFLAISSFS